MTEDPQEKSLDRLLAHLGTIEPDSAFNERIAHAAKARAAAKRPQASRPCAWRFATASAVAIALAALVTLRLTHPATTASPASPLPRKASGPSAGRWGFGPTPPPHKAQEALAPETIAAASIQPTQPMTSVAAPDLAATQQPSTSPCSEARLASYPAPPAPLTEQERLLLRVVHAHDTVEEAMLKSDALSLEEQRAREEFERFFPPPVPPSTDIPSADPAADPNSAQTPAAPTDSLSNDTPTDNPGAPK